MSVNESGGKYHGKFILPSQYPFKAPDIIMLTKSGRFEVGKKICLNFTGYHHELWQPAWTIRTMLTALRAFMETPAKGVGAMSVDKEQRKKYAKLSNNYKCSKCNVCLRDIKWPKIKKNNNNEKDKNDTNKQDTTCTVINTVTNTENNDNNDENENQQEPEIMQPLNLNDNNNNNNNNNNENDNDEIDNNNNVQRDENDESVSDSMSESSMSQSTISRKDKFLDSFTVFLVIVIAAILLKKFALRVLEQL